MKKNRKIVVGIGGASGAVYGERLLRRLDLYEELEYAFIYTKNGLVNRELEIAEPAERKGAHYSNDDFLAPFASGSARYDTMILCPASMGLIGRIAHGISSDLITRAADVILKERRKMIILFREMPLSTLHLKNLTILSEMGAVIMPAAPHFYHDVKSKDDLIDTVVDRILDQAELHVDTQRWQEEK